MEGKSNKKKTTIQFTEELNKINSDIEVLGEYINANTGISCRCLKCGYPWNEGEWTPRPSNLLHGRKCPNCSGHRRYTQESFERVVYSKNNDIKILGKYVNTSTPVLVKCKLCGKLWKPTGESLLLGKGCSNCKQKNAIRQRILTQNEFENKMRGINPNIEIIGKYDCMTSRVKVKCKVCGNIWNPIADNIIRGKGCRKCAIESSAKRRRISQSEYMIRVKKINPNIILQSEFLGTQKKIDVKCAVCEHRWRTDANSLLQGHGCPKCAKSATSFMEQFIYNSLNIAAEGVEVFSRDKTVMGQELDIYIPEKNYAIEPGAWFWHQTKVERDREKRRKCQEQGINLMIIYDSCPPECFVDDIRCYSFNLSSEDDYHTLKEIVKEICEKLDFRYELLSNKWNEIEDIARKNCKITTTEEFIQRLKVINPQITIIGKYRGNSINIACKCKICGCEWEAKPYHLLNGTGCRKCSGKDRTHNEFLELFKKKGNTNIDLIGEYTNATTKILCKCKKCGREWLSLPGHILEGKGCSYCNGGGTKAVICLTTGERFESIAQASKKMGISSSSIVNCCKTPNKHVKGLEFVYDNKR